MNYTASLATRHEYLRPKAVPNEHCGLDQEAWDSQRTPYRDLLTVLIESSACNRKHQAAAYKNHRLTERILMNVLR